MSDPLNNNRVRESRYSHLKLNTDVQYFPPIYSRAANRLHPAVFLFCKSALWETDDTVTQWFVNKSGILAGYAI